MKINQNLLLPLNGRKLRARVLGGFSVVLDEMDAHIDVFSSPLLHLCGRENFYYFINEKQCM